MSDKSETPSLEDRVMKFRMLALPGQPPMMHMGTSYLVEDLWRELAAAQNDLKTSGVLYWRERAEKAEAERDALREQMKSPPPKGTVYGDPETIKALREDAERWRWWRRWWCDAKDDMEAINALDPAGDSESALDAAIDAARAK